MTLNEHPESVPKRGLADAMCKILGQNKKLKESSDSCILSKGKTDREQLQHDANSGEEGEASKKLKKNDKKDRDLVTEIQRRKIWEDMGRVKPDVVDKEYERNLRRIASKGVVQLFNAVQEQQKAIDKTLKDSDLTRSKKDRRLKSLTKGKFLDSLNNKIKVEGGKEQKQSTWAALHEDFMMGGKIKDWDQNDSDEASVI